MTASTGDLNQRLEPKAALSWTIQFYTICFRCEYKTKLLLVNSLLSSARITKLLIEQDGPEWRDKLPEIPVVPLSVQQQHREKPVSIELAQARAARAAQEESE